MPVKVTPKSVLRKFKKSKKVSGSFLSTAGAEKEISEKNRLLDLYAKHAAAISYFVNSEEGELDRMISTTR